MHECTQWPDSEAMQVESVASRTRLAQSSVTHAKPDPHQLDEQETAFRLSLVEAFNDQAIVDKLTRIVQGANKDLVDSISSLRSEVISLRSALADCDTQIEALQTEVQQLCDANDALEQHGRRYSLRICGISDIQEDTTEALVSLANNVLELQPQLTVKDISVSHRLPKRRYAPAEEPQPIIARFVSRADRDRVIKARKHLKDYNRAQNTKIYINENLTATSAKLFAMSRSLQKKGYLMETWTYNGSIKVKTNEGVIKTFTNSTHFRHILPDVNPTMFQ